MVRVQEGDEREIELFQIEYALQLQFLLFLSGVCLLSRYHMRTILGVHIYSRTVRKQPGYIAVKT